MYHSQILKCSVCLQKQKCVTTIWNRCVCFYATSLSGSTDTVQCLSNVHNVWQWEDSCSCYVYMLQLLQQLSSSHNLMRYNENSKQWKVYHMNVYVISTTGCNCCPNVITVTHINT